MRLGASIALLLALSALVPSSGKGSWFLSSSFSLRGFSSEVFFDSCSVRSGSRFFWARERCGLVPVIKSGDFVSGSAKMERIWFVCLFW
jgi:hypothetical protein